MIEFFWDYTLTHRCHRIDSGKFYGVGLHPRLWEIAAVRDGYGSIFRKKDGYDLYHRGKKVMHGKTVKVLKMYVSVMEDRRGNKVFDSYSSKCDDQLRRSNEQGNKKSNG